MIDEKSILDNSYINTDPTFMGITVPGVEEIAASEILEKLPKSRIKNFLRGKVLFCSPNILNDLLKLRCLDNIYYVIKTFKIGPHKEDLLKLAKIFYKLNINNAIDYFKKGRKESKIIVRASRSGKHTYSRFDVADKVLQILKEDYNFVEGSSEDHDLSFRIDILDDNCILSLKLTPSTFRFRGADREFASGAVRPTVAHCLVWMSKPTKDDVFLDPFCGSGTIVSERSFYSATKIIASDINPDVVEKAIINLTDTVQTHNWDACNTGISNKTITSIITNLPWGKQIEVANIDELYISFFKEVKRIMIPGGRVYVLTDQEGSLNKALKLNNLQCEKTYTISLHGLLPSIFLIKVEN